MFKASSRTLAPIVKRPPVALKSAAGMAIALSLSCTLGACASGTASRDVGERLSDRGHEIGTYGAAWSAGKANVQGGEKSDAKSSRSLAEGQRDLARARTELARAEQQISDATTAKAAAIRRIEDGRVQMSRAEADYAATRAGPAAVNPRQ